MIDLFDRRLFCICVVALLAASGCDRSAAVSTPPAKMAPAVNESELHRRIHEQVVFNRDNRILDAGVNNAWQVVHGMLAYGRGFKIRENGKVVPCLDWVLAGGDLKGWGLQRGDHGVASTVIEGKIGAGHPDQWLGYLSQNGLAITDTVMVDGHKYTVADMLNQAKFDVFDGKELPWVLMATSTYLPIDASWPARDGSTWSSERIAEMEAKRPLTDGACGATHKLYALAVTVNRYVKEKQVKREDLTGGWKLANGQVQAAIKLAKEYQEPDGSFSTSFFARGGTSPDWSVRLYSTGHTLEFLVAAMDDAQFAEAATPAGKNQWLSRAALALTTILEHHQSDDLECGALYHAAHGLLLYGNRRWGDTFEPNESPAGDHPAANPSPDIAPAPPVNSDAPPVAP